MHSLRDIQLRFVTSLYDGNDAVVAPALVDGEPDASARLGVYRNNLREGFIKTLAVEFPVIEKLVGADFFRQTALQYQGRHPSPSGDLTWVGAQFPAWLRAEFGAGDYAYLPDVAELEWALQLVAIAPDVPPLGAEQLRDVDPSRYEDLMLEPHPATRLVESRFPIVQIWQSNQPGAAEQSIDLGAGGDRLLVRRRGDQMEFVRLTPVDFLFARMLARRTPLGLATDASLALDPEFDLVRALRMLTLAGAFARVALSH